jgi:hypothetical protein
MTTAAPWPPNMPEPDPVPHSWRCTRPPLEDHIVTGKDGRQQVIRRCPSCGGRERPARST